MLIKKAPDIRSSEITPKSVYLRRREFIQASAAALVAAGFPSLANEAAAILPGRQMADQLQGLDRSVRQKLRALLTVRSANDFKVDLSKLLAAGEAEQKAKFAKEDALSGTRSLQHILRMPTNANLNNVNAQADYAAAVIGFDGALTACRAGAGI